MPTSPRLRLGTRGSPLARWQADHVASLLAAAGVDVELVLITTQGDVTSGSLGEIGGQGLFTKEIQRALLDGRINLAVHSLKDLPTEPVEGLTLAAVPEREAAGDVLVSNRFASLENLAQRARVGTGSTRRRAQLLHFRPDLELLDIRGNVDTRLRKLDDGDYDAIVLAAAGLLRLGLKARITESIGYDVMLPAVGQGALGIEARSDDTSTLAILAPLNDAPTRCAVLAERALLRALRGGCLAPVGAWGKMDAETLSLQAVVLSSDGKQRLFAASAAPPQEAESLGQSVAQKLLDQGAAELIANSRLPP